MVAGRDVQNSGGDRTVAKPVVSRGAGCLKYFKLVLRLNQAATVVAPIVLNCTGVVDFNSLILAYGTSLLPPG